MTPPTRVVVADANVLINLLHVGRLEKCSRVPDLELVVPNHVWEEISYPAVLETRRFKMGFASFRELVK